MTSYRFAKFLVILLVAFQFAPASVAQESSGKRKIVIDQDAAGPAGTDQQSILLLIQSPKTEVLGITVVTGDAWLKDEVAHTLRMLELIGRTDIPVAAGAEFPLMRRKDETGFGEQHTVWSPGWVHGRRASTILTINSAICSKASPRRNRSTKTPHTF